MSAVAQTRLRDKTGTKEDMVSVCRMFRGREKHHDNICQLGHDTISWSLSRERETQFARGNIKGNGWDGTGYHGAILNAVSI